MNCFGCTGMYIGFWPKIRYQTRKKKERKEVDLTHIVTQKFSSSLQFGISSSWPHIGDSESSMSDSEFCWQ